MKAKKTLILKTKFDTRGNSVIRFNHKSGILGPEVSFDDVLEAAKGYPGTRIDSLQTFEGLKHCDGGQLICFCCLLHPVGPRLKRRVVITGLGAIAPNGIGKELFWEALISGKSGIKKIMVV